MWFGYWGEVMSLDDFNVDRFLRIVCVFIWSVSFGTLGNIFCGFMTSGDDWANGNRLLMASPVILFFFGLACGMRVKSTSLHIVMYIIFMCCIYYWLQAPSGWWATPPPNTGRLLPN